MIAPTCTGELTPQSGISASSLTITGPPGMVTGAPLIVTVVPPAVFEVISDAYIVGPNNSIKFAPNAPCGPTRYCTFASGLAITQPIGVECTPIGNTTQTATLIAHGVNEVDTAIATVTCTSSGGGGGPILDVAPMSHDFMNVAVNATSAALPIVISDDPSATQPLSNVMVTIDDGSDYLLDCHGSCMFGSIPVGAPVTVDVTFTPNHPGPSPATVYVTAGNVTGQQDVGLMGSGQGVAIVLDQPNPKAANYGIHFGSIGLGPPAPATVQIEADGNIPSDTGVTLTATGASVLSVSGADIPLTGGGSAGSVVVTCGSNAAGSASGTITLTTTSAYAGSDITIPVDCTIEDTFVSVSPNMVQFGSDFGELWRDAGNPPTVVMITLTNAGSATATVGPIAAPSSKHVTVSQPMTMMLGAGATTTFAVTVSPDAFDATGHTFDEDLTATPVVLSIPVDETALTVTVTGRIVKAATALTPPASAAFDLGTLCINTTTTGTVTLTDTGTAHVAAFAPQVGSGYLLDGGGSGELAPGMATAVTVSPTADPNPGEVDDMLTWDTDVPAGSGNYTLGLKTVFVAVGAAISPGTAAFPLQPSGIISTPQTIHIANCDPTPVVVTVGATIGHVGETSAWQVMTAGMYPLESHGSTVVSVAFAPGHGGHYDAELPIVAGGVTTKVQLTGDASGAQGRLATDFYACGCHGAGTPVQGVPVVAVIVFVAWRRPTRRRR